MSETHYAPVYGLPLSTLGVMANHTWLTDPKRLAFTLARYKFVSRMLAGCRRVLEVGCADAWATAVVAQAVEHVTAVDFDQAFIQSVANKPKNVLLRYHDMTQGPVWPLDRLPTHFDAAYAMDVLEHVPQEFEGAFLGNIATSIGIHGTFVCGTPSAESQPYASSVSRAGHVNCKTEQQLRETLKRIWRCVYVFGMNDEVVHTGYGPMCHYRIAVCTGATL